MVRLDGNGTLRRISPAQSLSWYHDDPSPRPWKYAWIATNNNYYDKNDPYCQQYGDTHKTQSKQTMRQP